MSLSPKFHPSAGASWSGAAVVTIWWSETTSHPYSFFSWINKSDLNWDMVNFSNVEGYLKEYLILTHQTSWGANQLWGFCSTCHVSVAAVYWTSLWRDWSTSQDVLHGLGSRRWKLSHVNEINYLSLHAWSQQWKCLQGVFWFQLNLNDDTLFVKSRYFPTICNDWPSHSNCTKRVFLFSATWAV